MLSGGKEKKTRKNRSDPRTYGVGANAGYGAVPQSDPRDHPLFQKERQDRIMDGEEPGSLLGSFRRNPIVWTIGLLSVAVMVGVSIWAIVNSASGSWASFGADDDGEEWDGSNKPHIIYILADDMGWNSVGYQDYDLSFVTPTLTSLAQGGVILDNFYAQEVCTPARASLLTGRYPLTVGMQYSMVQTAIPWGLDLHETTLATALKSDDYATHALGKWHLGHYTPRFLPTARGFDTFFGFLNGESYYWSKRNPDHTVFHDILYSTDSCYAPYKEEDMHDYSTFLYRDKAKAIIEEHNSTEKSLFMYLAFQAVHDPFVDIGVHLSGMPIEYLDFDTYSKIVDKESGVVGRKRRQYAMALSVLDSAVADIIDTLDQKGMLSNSVIIFSSDNGGCFGSGGKNGPLRGTKGSMFEGGTKVDAFMWSPLFPRKIHGNVYSNLFHISDMFPTILAMTGTAYAPAEGYELDGVNHFAQILGEADSVPRDYMLYNYYHKVDAYMFDVAINGSFAVRDTQYKLMHAFNSSTYALWYQPEEQNEDDDSITEENRCSSSMNNDGEFTVRPFSFPFLSALHPRLIISHNHHPTFAPQFTVLAFRSGQRSVRGDELIRLERHRGGGRQGSPLRQARRLCGQRLRGDQRLFGQPRVFPGVEVARQLDGSLRQKQRL